MRQAIQQRWTALSSRERMIVLTAGGLLAAGLLFALAIDPMLEQLDQLDRQAAGKQRAIRELTGLGAEYATARARLTRLEERMAAGQGKFSLLSYLEEAASYAQVRDRITGMQPQISPPTQGYKEMSVELRLDGVQMPQVVALLVKLEDSPYLLQVKRLQIKPRFDAPHLLEATLMVSTYEKAQ